MLSKSVFVSESAASTSNLEGQLPFNMQLGLNEFLRLHSMVVSIACFDPGAAMGVSLAFWGLYAAKAARSTGTSVTFDVPDPDQIGELEDSNNLLIWGTQSLGDQSTVGANAVTNQHAVSRQFMLGGIEIPVAPTFAIVVLKSGVTSTRNFVCATILYDILEDSGKVIRGLKRYHSI